MNDHDEHRRAHVAWATVRIICVVCLAALGLLPIGDWLGISFQRALSFQAVGWGTGSLLVALLTVVLAIATPDTAKQALGAVIRTWEKHPVGSTVALSICSTALYLTVAWTVFDARPLLIDELVQVFQARIFVSGRLWLPLAAHPEFTSIMHMVEQNGRWYGQFPPGGPAMLALGELVHAPWLVNPVFGGLSVATFATLLRWSGFRGGVSLGAVLAFGFAPFVVFQSASYMNHVPTVTWLLIAAASLVRATRDDRDRVLAGFVCGTALGIAATIRPLDAAAWALPAAFWLGARAFTRRHWGAFIASGIGVAIPMSLMMWVNYRTTGGPLTFGYTVLWGPAHGLGFHTSPWGESHTVARGLALVAAYFNRLNEYMFEVPVPSLLPALATLLLARGATAIERYLLTSCALLVGSYFAYWHDGFYLGPRFVYPLAPIVALLVAQLPGIVRTRFRPAFIPRLVDGSYVAAILLGAVLVLPSRVRIYTNGFQSERWNLDAIAKQAGATGGVVLVRESWGAQVIDRLWALGVSRSLTEILYRHVDTCGLDDAVGKLEAAGVRGADAEARLTPMLADSARIQQSRMSPDATERVLPGSSYTRECATRIFEDRGGYTLFAPALLARDSSTTWLHDLHARDTLVVSPRGAQPIWLLRRPPGDSSWTPVLVRVPLDSLERDWKGARAPGSK